MPHLIHANALVFNTKGILIFGDSGSGKSDLSLRLIDSSAVLISDDYTLLDITATDNVHRLYASCPCNLKGKLEVRGIGIIEKPYIQNHQIDYAIELVTDYPRMREALYFEYNSIKIRKFLLNPFEISVIHKIKLMTEID